MAENEVLLYIMLQVDPIYVILDLHTFQAAIRE